MATIRELNQAAPFWEFIANVEEQGLPHPFFAGFNHNHISHDETDNDKHFSGPGGFSLPHRGRHGPHHRHRHHRGEPITEDEEPTQDEAHEEDDSASSSSEDGDEDHDEPRKCKRHGRHGGGFHMKGGKGRHGRDGHGPGPRGPGPWAGGKFDHPHPAAFGPWGGDFHGPHGGFGHGPHGRFSPYGRGKHMRGGFKHGGRGGPRGFGPFGFREHGHKHHHKHHQPGAFVHPEVDVFDTPDIFLVHVSLPGAKKEAVEVKWDPKKFELNVSGSIERPGDEELLKTLALDERRVGTFDRKVRLGSVYQPVEINVEGITAEMENGVLSVRLPKVEADVVMVTRVDVQ
ncbi:HSP20-like chaperone [Aspergillus sclerotioniger CBS 115572]|uniref:HSP20-like chaperone n=1 Tax=Aspergillus sclerotioniger CBS 115572 TaxID=1450535 RepID=A0A317VR12_9EURO|nr:HSP20-like chaperone [Aspergillus sclerotioniger CBS 115572]PWY75999.1 HSP20-like chaperone [Aspergillus sclerotioniger CBS 115572]